jgi:hypothetical protein
MALPERIPCVYSLYNKIPGIIAYGNYALFTLALLIHTISKHIESVFKGSDTPIIRPFMSDAFMRPERLLLPLVRDVPTLG